jgi:hypothetical protein
MNKIKHVIYSMHRKFCIKENREVFLKPFGVCLTVREIYVTYSLTHETVAA